MYNWFSKTAVFASLLTLSLSSCKKDETKVSAEFGAAPVLAASTTNVGTLVKADAAKTVVTYSWNPYTITASDGNKLVSPVLYTLQLAKVGTNFATVWEFPIDGAATSSRALTTVNVNSAFLGLKLPFGQPGQLDVRLKTAVVGNVESLYSNVTQLTATPYDECVAPNSDVWSLIGPAGIDWNTDVPLTWNCVDNAYVTTRTLNAGEFKFRRNSDWGINLGSAGTSVATIATGATVALASVNNPPNLSITTAGTYTIKLKVTGSGATTAGSVVVTK